MDFLLWARWCPRQRDPGRPYHGRSCCCAAVQDMLTATRTEALYTLDLLFLEVPSPAAATIVLYAFLRSQHLV